MDKKILLGGAAALLLVGNMYATPASASIDLSIGGEAKLTANMSECGPAAATDGSTAGALIDAISGTAATFATVNAFHTAAANGGTALTMVVGDEALFYSDAAGPCAGADRAGVDWGFGKELTIGASGTLANGLEVSFSDKIDLTDTAKEQGAFELVLGSAVGTLTFKDGAPSAVDAAMVTGKKDLDVTGDNLGFHATETAGSAGMGILWNAPSVGDLDLYVGWAPNSAGNGLDSAAYENTFSIGAVMSVSGIELGAGYESASANAGGACAATTDAEVTGTAAANTSGILGNQSFVDAAYGGDYCGDQTLMYIGATMSAADIGISAGYSVLDTDEADKTVMSIGASTAVGAYDVSLDYRQTTKDYEFGAVEDTQSVVAVGLGTSLGDGVDLGLSFSTSDVDLLANAADFGSSNYYYAEGSLTVGF